MCVLLRPPSQPFPNLPVLGCQPANQRAAPSDSWFSGTCAALLSSSRRWQPALRRAPSDLSLGCFSVTRVFSAWLIERLYENSCAIKKKQKTNAFSSKSPWGSSPYSPLFLQTSGRNRLPGILVASHSDAIVPLMRREEPVKSRGAVIKRPSCKVPILRTLQNDRAADILPPPTNIKSY